MAHPLLNRPHVNLARHTGNDAVQTVMIVEDEFWIRLDLADSLREAGFRVVECSSADDAIDLLRAGSPVDALVTDVRMPGAIDGLELAHLVTDEYPDIAVLVTSAESLRSPAPCLFLPKPYLFLEVLAFLRTASGT